MTYQEALDAKSEYGNKIIEKGKEFLVLIAPKTQSDLLKFLASYKEEDYNDDICKKYSMDNQFQLYFIMSNNSRRLTF